MINTVRAWKDASYRASLSAEEQAMIPANPAGDIELSDAALESIFGAGSPTNEIHVDTNGVICAKTLNLNLDLLGNILSNNPQTVICY